MEQHVLRFSPTPAPSEPIEIGAGANGDLIGATQHHLLRNGKPWYPVMGEFHYSRYPADEWETELRKMKAAGVGVVATYVFWIHHEEEQGVWRTDGNLDLRRFLELCGKVGLDVILRIGPWAHGECRNGGFPDWLQHDEALSLRTDDPAYLAHVRTLYQHIYDQAKGLLLKDGGPVVGIQIENEFGHCGGVSGGSGLVHMMSLKHIAQEVGFGVPIYTATGWGGANVVDGEMLPVMGGYADAPWDASVSQLPANHNYLLKFAPNDPMIGSDWKPGTDVFTFDFDRTPYLTAELGGGVQCTFHRRPLISARDTSAQALCRLATGANLLGYYMFHGGTHPMGKHHTMQEDTASGSYTDVPVRSYDFQAPLGEFGSMHESYSELKALHTLIADVGESLAGSISYFPENQVLDAENTSDLRFCVRWNEDTEEGFLFINNHQRLRTMQPHTDVRFTIIAGNRTFHLPPMDIPSDFCGVIPFHLRVGSHRLLTTNGVLLCRLGDVPVLYPTADAMPVATFDDESSSHCLYLTREEAMHAFRVGDALYVTDGCLYEENGRLTLIHDAPHTIVRRVSDGTSCRVDATAVKVDVSLQEMTHTDDCAVYNIEVEGAADAQAEDVLLDIDYTGDHIEIYQDGVLIADWYTTGLPLHMALKRFGYPTALEVRVYPVTRPTYYDISTPVGMRLNAVHAMARYRSTIDPDAFGV